MGMASTTPLQIGPHIKIQCYDQHSPTTCIEMGSAEYAEQDMHVQNERYLCTSLPAAIPFLLSQPCMQEERFDTTRKVELTYKRQSTHHVNTAAFAVVAE